MAATDYLAEARAAAEKLRVNNVFAGTSTPSVAYVAIAEQLALANILRVLDDPDNLLLLTDVQSDELRNRARALLGYGAL